CAVAKRCRLVELHSKAVVFRQAIRTATECYLYTSLLHPNLLINTHVAPPCFVSHSRAGRQNNLDDLNRRGEVGGRNVASYVSRLGIAPPRPIISSGHRVRRCSRVFE